MRRSKVGTFALINTPSMLISEWLRTAKMPHLFVSVAKSGCTNNRGATIHGYFSESIRELGSVKKKNGNMDRGFMSTFVEFAHHGEFKVLAVVPRVVKPKHGRASLGLQFESGQDEGLVGPLLH